MWEKSIKIRDNAVIFKKYDAEDGSFVKSCVIPSELYPLNNGKNNPIRTFHNGNTKEITDEKVKELIDKVPYRVGGCYLNTFDLLKLLQDKDKKEPYIVHRGIYWGNTQDMEDLFILFGGDRKKVYERTKCIGHHARFKYVMDRLDRESKEKDAIFEKCYINYPGIINRPTRCFVLKEGDKSDERKP